MKRIFKSLLVLLALIITSVGLIACVEKQPPGPIVETEQYTVTFDTLGGGDVPSVKVNKDTAVSKPVDPIKEGFDFIYWYLVEGQEYDFTTPVTSNITLKANWEVKELVVTFDSQEGSEIESIKVTYNTPVTKPNDPTKKGFNFGFWSLVEGEEFDFTTPITSNITLTANWVELTIEEKIEADYQQVLAELYVSDIELNFPTSGPIYGSKIEWRTRSPYVYVNNENGIAPDYELVIANLYNEALLLEILNNHVWS